MRLASDVIFVIRESSHDHFRREGNDLIYDINLDLPYFLSTNQIKAEVPLIEGGIYRQRSDPKFKHWKNGFSFLTKKGY